MHAALVAVARGERVQIEGDDLVRAAAAEGMLGLLGRAAINPHLDLQMKAAAIEANGIFMTAELGRIFTAFRAANIPLLAFKGPVLSQQLYGHPGLRSFSDLDVVTSPRDADAAEALLRTIGYRELEPLGIPERRINRRFAGELLFTNDGNGILLDFNTLFSNRQFPIHLPFQDVWERRTEVAIGEHRIASFGNSDLVILTCSHASKHLWHKLEYVAQIAALARMRIDWNEVDRLAIEARVARQVGLSFLIARDLLGIEPAPVARCLASATPLLGRAKKLVGKAQDATGRDHFVLLDRKRDAIGSIAQSIFIPTHEDWHSSRMPWLFRPFRLLRRFL